MLTWEINKSYSSCKHFSCKSVSFKTKSEERQNTDINIDCIYRQLHSRFYSLFLSNALQVFCVACWCNKIKYFTMKEPSWKVASTLIDSLKMYCLQSCSAGFLCVWTFTLYVLNWCQTSIYGFTFCWVHWIYFMVKKASRIKTP